MMPAGLHEGGELKGRCLCRLWVVRTQLQRPRYYEETSG